MNTDTPETDKYADADWWTLFRATEHCRKLERERDEARFERDRLAVVLQNIRSGYGGQIPDPTCDCGDCEFLITIDNALQYITKPN